jgi:RimJ/RimL family protein N-acetyltransferase
MRALEYAGPIQTERLVLRAFQPDDFEALYAMRSGLEAARYLYWEAQTADEVRATLQQKIGFLAIRAEGDVLALAVALGDDTGEVVADVILRCLSWEHGVLEIGFIAHPKHQGRGYTTEASRALLALAFTQAEAHRVVGHLEARNGASARVLEKLGMRREAHFVENEWVKGEWQSELVYAILEREWRARNA